MLGITTLEPKTTLLELSDHSVIKLVGTLLDVMVSVDMGISDKFSYY